ncbi:hypothetical protein QZH41_004583 [Actinostola sp. cb2023]|nr:hypothetical protein QZH41_004583 [Actinostola sp. cb2023]
MDDVKDDKDNEKETDSRTRIQTEKGKEYQLQLIRSNRNKAYKQWRKQINRSAAVIVDTIDIASLRQERNELQTCFNELTHQQDRIEDELSNEEDKQAVTSEYDRWDKENQEMFKTLNNTIADLLSSQSDRSSVKSNRTRATSQSYASSSSSRSSISRKAEVTIKAAKLDAELKFLYLESENAAALRKQQDEMEKLRIMKELAIAKAELTAFAQVKREEDDENATPPSDCGGSELLHEYLETQLSVLTPSEVGGVKTPPNGTATSSPGDHQKSSSINESNAKKPTPRENFAPTTPSNNDAISRLADLLSERHGRDNLPRPEPEVFDGNLLRFPLWMKSFETLIENQTTSPSERLYYLGRYTGGEAKEAIGGLLPLNSENAYSKAKKLLRNRFGNTFLISDAYRKRINDWPRIPAYDGPSLRKFSDFLEHCKAAMEEIKYLNVLNDPDENQRMLKKLPSYLVARWSRIVDRWITDEDCEDNEEDGKSTLQRTGNPPFTEFCKFLKGEARIACNPVTSLRLPKSGDGKEELGKVRTSVAPSRKRDTTVSSFATEVKSTADGAKKETKQDTCPLCKDAHDLDTCKDFLKLNFRERKEMTRNKGLCWGCLRYGHKSRQCRKKKTCQVCEGSHPSSLHDYSYKPNSNTTAEQVSMAPENIVTHRVGVRRMQSHEATSSHSLIVPVWLCHDDNPDNKLMVYALLDEQSDACFIRDSTLNKLGVNGPEVSIKLATVLGQETIQSKKITGLTVRGVREEKDIPMPRVYTREVIPARRSQIPRPETALKWPHLKRITNDLMPYRGDVEIGLLIGLNCTRAIKPHEIIPGKDDEPYAKRTALGWGIIGVINTKDCDDNDDLSEISTNQTIAQEIKIPQDKKICYFACQTQVKEVLNPQQVSKMFEMDFNEKETDGRTLSYEDRRFLKIVGKEIHQLDDGHYEMPLPFKNDITLLENNKTMVMKRLLHLRKRLQNDTQYRKDYVSFMKNIIDSGHAERVPSNEVPLANGKVWYIPHHGVYHPKKPGKIRVVFDCSATYNGESLNRQLLQGPDLTNNLVGVLFRFRQEPIAFMCDIEKMFHQVKVNKECRDYLRFLWWEDGNTESEPAEFRMTVHLFGAVSSPGCANFGLKKAADDFQEEFGNKAAEFVKEDFYVDDGLKSVPSVGEAIDLIKTPRLCARKEASAFTSLYQTPRK